MVKLTWELLVVQIMKGLSIIILFESVNATKKVGRIPILENIDLVIRRGENIAIVGENGSGKSSLLKLIAGIYEPTIGKVNRSTRKIAYVPEHFPTNIRFKMMEYLLLVGEMSGRKRSDLVGQIKEYSEIFHVENYLEMPLKSCSKGTKQKVGIIQALMAAPDLMVLDEPLTGLDFSSQQKLLHRLELKSNSTIVFTTHENLLIDGIAHQVFGLENGKITSKQNQKSQQKIMLIKAYAKKAKKHLDNQNIIHAYWEGDHTVFITVEAVFSDTLIIHLIEKGFSIHEVKEKR
jgi:ABC-2 type transport system ATP-binding protein